MNEKKSKELRRTVKHTLKMYKNNEEFKSSIINFKQLYRLEEKTKNAKPKTEEELNKIAIKELTRKIYKGFKKELKNEQ